MSAEVVNVGAVIVAVFSIIYFISIYGTTTWEKSKEGINFMLFPTGFLMLAFSSISRRADILPTFGESILSIAAWILVSILMIQRGNLVRRAQKEHREWRKNRAPEDDNPGGE